MELPWSSRLEGAGLKPWNRGSTRRTGPPHSRATDFAALNRPVYCVLGDSQEERNLGRPLRRGELRIAYGRRAPVSGQL